VRPPEAGAEEDEMVGMPAAVLVDEGTLAITERPRPRVRRPGDVLIDVEACGICGTDLHILSRPPGHPFRLGVVLGHEFVGIVAEAGSDVKSLRPGDRVVVEPNVPCGACRWCHRGLASHCEHCTSHGIFIDGGLAPQVAVTARACHRIAHSVPAHLAALAEPLACVVYGARLIQAQPSETVVVVGAGPIGLLFCALLDLAGATVVAVEPSPLRRSLALNMGAVAALDPDADDVHGRVLDLTAGFGADAAIDAVGTQMATCLDLVRKGARILLFGIDTQARAEIAQSRITIDELQVLGAHVGQSTFPGAIRLLEQGRLDLEPIVTDRVHLDQLPDALERLRAGNAAKVVVELQ
jgi:2-desacetyl-2-hydroxyethyl bacteriochlorophyllide A dehydrogenase